MLNYQIVYSLQINLLYEFLFFIFNKIMSRLGITAKLDNQKQVVNVNPVNNISVSVRSPSDVQNSPSLYPQESEDNQDTAKVNYNSPYESVNDIYIPATEENIKGLTNDLIKLTSTNEALKIIIQMFKENPMYVNHLLLVDDEKLGNLIKLMTNADSVSIDCEDIGAGCTCGPQKYRKVNAIYVNKDDKTLNLKYDFPSVTKELKELGINIKCVW